MRQTLARTAVAAFIAIASFESVDAREDAIEVGKGSTAIFADAAEGVRLLTHRDEFIRRLSAFDRATRLKTDREVSEPEFLQFIARQVRPWSSAEKARIRAALSWLNAELRQFPPLTPDEIILIKTTGGEEGTAAYTRANAIILPAAKLQGDDAQLRRTLAHELFHLISRHHPRLRAALYREIGFEKCVDIDLPPSLAAREFTNPDALGRDNFIRVSAGGETVAVVPVLLAKRDRYDVTRGGEFFDHIELRFLALTREKDKADGRSFALEELSGFYERVGRNTDYVVHPEEILADNFAALILGDHDTRTPWLLQRMRALLQRES